MTGGYHSGDIMQLREINSMAQRMFDVRGPAVTRHSLHKYNHGTSIIDKAVLLAFLIGHVIRIWLKIGYEHIRNLR